VSDRAHAPTRHLEGPDERPSLVGALSRLFRRSTPAASMPKARRVIIGLGNPGPEYEATRHNAGFMVADAVAAKAGLAFEPGRGPFVIAEGSWRATPLAVAKTAALYMNQSGTAVRKLIARYGITPDDVLVVYDDIALDPGQIRLRAGGSAGGHNGVQDVIDQLGTAAFPRLRIGIGSSFPRGHQVDYVLGPVSEEEERPAGGGSRHRGRRGSADVLARGPELPP
jgi:peptidyl-tRNA hydrolase, PTH1 family